MRSGIISQYCCRLPAWTRASCLPSAQYPPVTEVPVPLACLSGAHFLGAKTKLLCYRKLIKCVGPNTGVDKATGEVWKPRGQTSVCCHVLPLCCSLLALSECFIVMFGTFKLTPVQNKGETLLVNYLPLLIWGRFQRRWSRRRINSCHWRISWEERQETQLYVN